MASMVDGLKYRIGDKVRIISLEQMGDIVDVVDDGNYRISTADGIITVEEEDIQLIKETNDIVEESYISEGKLMQYAKEFFKKIKRKTKLDETLRQNDLEHLVSPYVSVDQYTSKISEDNVTIAFFCAEREVAADLLDFLEKMYFVEIRDIEISDSLTEDNKYILYVEFDRNPQFPKILIDVLDSINLLINKKIEDWDFVSFNMKKKMQVSVENIKKNVRLTPLTSTTNIDNAKTIKKESIEYSKDNIKRTYIDEGFITTKEFDNVLEESEFDNGINLEREVLEYNFPSSEVLITETHAYIITNNKIKKLGFK